MVNFNNILEIDGDKRDGFEEFVCQLARKEKDSRFVDFTRLGNPDGGLECYWKLNDDSIIGWQAKYFPTAFSTSQWNQIERSVKNATDNFKDYNLKKIIVVVPTDAPIEMNKKREEKIKKWKEFENANPDLEIVFWGKSEIIERISSPEMEGFKSFWFGELELPNHWFEERAENTILNFKNKYNPNLSIKTDNEKYFNSISRNESFKEYFFSKINEFLYSLEDYYRSCNDKINKLNLNELNNLNFESNFRSNIENIKQVFKSFEKVYSQIEKLDIVKITYHLGKIHNLSSNLEKIINSLNDKIEKKDEESLKNLYYYNLRFENSINQFKSFLESEEIKVINNPFLIFDGEAGIGKTFLFVQTLDEKIKNDENCILLFGHQFSIYQDPKTTLMDELGLRNFNFDNLLDALECKAKIQKSRVLILIDALNESKDINLWNEYLSSFLNSISKRKWIGCALSIRKEYVEDLEIHEEIDEIISKVTLEGFKYNTQEAILHYFDHYHLPVNNIQLFHHEFYNPLFLKLYCETISNDRTINDLKGLINLFDAYLKSINKKLSSIHNYSKDINLVKAVLLKLIENGIYHGLKFEETYMILLNFLKDYNLQANFLNSLIDEGLLIRLKWGEIDSVYITFQLLSDYLNVEYLLKNNNYVDFCNSFTKDSESSAIQHPNIEFSDKEILNMLSIYIPENFDEEFYSLIPENLKEEYDIIESFVYSLKWRTNSVKPHVVDYIEDYVLKYQGTSDDFLKILIYLAPIKNHLLNADFTHKFLFNMDLSYRDYIWTIFINTDYRRYKDLEPIVKFCFSKSFEDYSENSIKLYSILLSWFLTSSHRKLRDYSTKALVYILKDRIDILIEVLKRFENVNDPYVYERLFAVAYGSTLLNTNNLHLDKLAIYIYNIIFNVNGEVYPNILLRDYAKNTIEYILNLEDIPEINQDKIKPPYFKIDFPEIPSDDEIEILKDENDAIRKIFHSMSVQYDNEGNMCGLGDFGRYDFESNLATWEKQLNDDNISYYDLMKVALKRIFELGYDVELHGDFDRHIRFQSRGRPLLERIGKKYQWMVLYELLAKVSDKYKKIDREYFVNNNEIDFVGAWQLFIRDIDPTILNLDCNLEIENPFTNLYDNANFEKEDYMLTIDDVPNPINLIETTVTIDDSKFNALILEGYFNWKEELPLLKDKYQFPDKDVNIQIKCYLIPKNYSKNVINYLKYRRIEWRLMPESYELHNIFNKEIPNSSPFNWLYDKNYNECRVIEHLNLKVELPAINSSAIDDDSINENYYLKINKKLFNYFNLSYGELDSFMYHENNVCGFDFSEIDDTRSLLMFDKELLQKYADENNLDIIFTVLGDKRYFQNHINNFLDFSGVYAYNDSKLEGKLNIFNKIHFNELSTSIVGLINEIETGDADIKYYFDKDNDIIYQVFDTDSLENISKFKFEIFKENDEVNGLKLDIGYINEISHVIDDRFDNEIGISHKEGHILISNKNDKFYVIGITTSKFNVNKNLRGSLYKNHEKYLIKNLKISQKHTPFKLDKLIKSIEMSKEKFIDDS